MKKGGIPVKNRRVSLSQLLKALTLALFTLGTQRLFHWLAPAGSAAWLCPLAAGGVVVLLGALVGRRTGLGDPLGPWSKRMGQTLALLLLLWGIFLTAAHAARVGSRLSDSLRASPALVTVLVLALAGWMAAGGLPAFLRACEIFSLAVGAGFVLILLSGVFRLRWDYVLLWQGQELAQVPLGALSTAGTLAAGCYILLLLPAVTPEEKGRQRVLKRLGGLFAALAAAMILVLGRFGPVLTSQINRPFFQMVSGLGFEGAFQRLEELVSALWVLGDAALLGLLLLSLQPLLTQLAGPRPSRGRVWKVTGAVLLASLPASFWKGVLAGPVLPAGNLLAGGLIVALSTLAARREKTLKKFQKRG